MNGAAYLRSLASRFATRPLRRGLPLLILALAFGAAPLEAKASLLHPANIPVVRAKVQPNGTMEVEITFDILAFVLDQTPQIVLDAPMNGLLDGSAADLQLRLNDAKKRFLEGFAIGDAQHAGVVDSLKFPTAAEIHQVVDGGQNPSSPRNDVSGHEGSSQGRRSLHFLLISRGDGNGGSHHRIPISRTDF